MCFLSGRLTGTGNILAHREAGYGAVMGVTLSVDSHLDSFVAGAGLETLESLKRKRKLDGVGSVYNRPSTD